MLCRIRFRGASSCDRKARMCLNAPGLVIRSWAVIGKIHSLAMVSTCVHGNSGLTLWQEKWCPSSSCNHTHCAARLEREG